MRRSAIQHMAIAAGLTASSALTACTTTQERSAALAKDAGKAAEAKRFRVGRTSSVLKVKQVTTLKGDGASTVVVKVQNTAREAQLAAPIGVDLYDDRRRSIYTNRIDGLDAALNTIPLAEPGTSYWVNNQLPGMAAARTRVRIGTSRLRPPKALPQLRISGVRLADDGGVKVARGKVANLSGVEQRRLTLFAVALRDGRVVAAGRAVIDRLAAKGGRRQRFNVYFTGDPAGARLLISAPPSTLGGA